MRLTIGQFCTAVILGVLTMQVNARFDMKLVRPAITGNFIPEGDFVELQCSFTSQAQLQNSTVRIELKDGNVTLSEESPHIVRGRAWLADDSMIMYYKLSFYNVTFADAGTYQCVNLADPSFDPFPHDINVYRVTGTDAVVDSNSTTATLSCLTSFSPRNTLTASPEGTLWYRKSMSGDLTEVMTKGNITVSQTEMEIKHVNHEKYDDVGEYVCQVTPAKNSKPADVTVSVIAAAGVKHDYDKDYSIKRLQGDPTEVVFHVYGFPVPDVRWTKGDDELDFDSRMKLVGDNTTKVNSTISFATLEYTDRGMYTCEVSNAYGNGTAAIFVRVKDRLAALWPFLGICAQVAVLVAIIFFYEKNKAKKKDKKLIPDVPATIVSPGAHENPAIDPSNPDGSDVRRRTGPTESATYI